ncbi:MAG: ABC transporter ATP-binding protein [Desulfurococcaceae archaeon]
MITTRNLLVKYKPSNIEALKDVNITIPSNVITCIIGPNASGKTTLLKAIANIVDYDGSVLIDGDDTRDLLNTLRKTLSYTRVIDSGVDYLGARVIDVLLASRYPVSKGFCDTSEDIQEVKKAAEELGIEHLLNRRIGELSSGELQRVVITTALVRRPRIMLFDELDAHIDAVGKTFLSRYMRKLSKESTIIISTHDVVFGFYTCDYFIVMSSGHVIFQGWIDDLVNKPEPLEKAYGVPFRKINVDSRAIMIPLY